MSNETKTKYETTLEIARVLQTSLTKGQRSCLALMLLDTVGCTVFGSYTNIYLPTTRDTPFSPIPRNDVEGAFYKHMAESEEDVSVSDIVYLATDFSTRVPPTASSVHEAGTEASGTELSANTAAYLNDEPQTEVSIDTRVLDSVRNQRESATIGGDQLMSETMSTYVNHPASPPNEEEPRLSLPDRFSVLPNELRRSRIPVTSRPPVRAGQGWTRSRDGQLARVTPDLEHSPSTGMAAMRGVEGSSTQRSQVSRTRWDEVGVFSDMVSIDPNFILPSNSD